MLEQIDLDKSLSKNEYKKIEEEEIKKLSRLQRIIKEEKIPVLLVFEGWSASGRGKLMNELITPLDQRGVKVYTVEEETQEEKAHSFFWPFWTNLPPKGKIHLYNMSWYKRAMDKQRDEEEAPRYGDINFFEEQLVKDRMVIVKFFLHISKEEQDQRFEKLKSRKDTKWRVSKKDQRENHHYEEYLESYDRMLIATDTSYAPWHVIEATDKRYAAAKIFSTVEKAISKAVAQKKAAEEQKKQEPQDEFDKWSDQFKAGVLNQIDLSKKMTKEEYKAKIEKLQSKLFLLQNRMYQEKIPVIIALEGWDAAGKGGAIKRITEKLDPRAYQVIPISAPNDMEQQFPYLWRFYMHFPRKGHLAVFDRTWYGRVLVERVEGFADKKDWQRAYSEINRMEQSLTNDGYIILKFWLHIDPQEQEKRFKAREEDPEKQWKITEEDWRNRAKWKEYEDAVDEMVVRTSTDYAPWTIVEADSKYYARVKILETIVETVEKRLEGK